MTAFPLRTSPSKASWVGGLAEWIEDDTAFLSVAFTWKLPEARDRAAFHRACGRKVRAGGPGLFVLKHYLNGVAEIGDNFPDAVRRHHPLATIASRGCPVGCWFCIVPKMEGREFTLLPDFTPRPILCDNNLSALPSAYQDYIIARYRAAGVTLMDANSGFEPKTFDDEVYQRWQPINRGPWRFAYDETGERDDVLRVLKMLHDEPRKKKRVYVLIGNEPQEMCIARLREVIDGGGDPHVQPLMKLNALDRVPWIRFDWTHQRLIDVARWANRHLWKYMALNDYNRHFRRDCAIAVKRLRQEVLPL